MVVLGLACEEPMHPYRMQALIKQRGKDKVANVAARNSVYQTIDALLRAGLIAVRETSRDERRPERTIYEATADGRAALRAWVRGGLATPAREFPEFPAVLSILMGVTGPDDLRALLEARVAPLAERLADLEKPVPGVPRLFLLEEEYMAAMVRAEIAWLRAIVADLKSGKLRFPTEEDLRRLRSAPGGPSDEAVRRMAEELATSSESSESSESKKAGTKKRGSERRGRTRDRRG
jgi:DNA-binding PadR family transcriptional regulator